MHGTHLSSSIRIALSSVAITLVFTCIPFVPSRSFAIQNPQEEEQANELPPRKTDPSPLTQDPDWARKYLADDPLVTKEIITLEDISAGIRSPRRRSSVIRLHFSKVTGATKEEKVTFLKNAMSSEYPEVQQQAASELQASGQLPTFVIEALQAYLASEDPLKKRIAIVALEYIEIPASDLPPSYFENLMQALTDPDNKVSQAAYSQLLKRGAEAVPALIQALSQDDPQRQITAAKLLSEIVGKAQKTITPEPAPPDIPFEKGFEPPDIPFEKGFEPPDTALMEKGAAEPTKPKVIAKAAAAQVAKHEARTIEKKLPTTVTVYFGTNREMIDKPTPGFTEIAPYPFLAFILFVGSLALFRGSPSDPDAPTHHLGCRAILLPLIMLVAMAWALLMFRSELQESFSVGVGPNFGPRRDAAEKVHYGTCEVSIPPNHKSGELERPTFGPEDENDHVVLQRTEELKEQVFFDLLKSKLAELPISQRDCFVFIHGFNVDFENAARRTAQIHYDLKFTGIPIFFSWPSRANIRHYFSDRNEIEFSRYVIKQFLIDVSERIKAERIHVIAHSMGADATCRAIAELGDRGKIFDQIILAAPDIDREVFRQQLVPRLTKTANRTTLYCSKNDLALLASRAFNDGFRAGDSSQGALVTKEIDTIDASDIDTDLLGHSYYGDCIPLLEDVHQLIGLSLPPIKRQLRPWPVDEQLQYWTLDSKANRDSSQGEKDQTENETLEKEATPDASSSNL
jgi:esterase/lipase superfamily enzyme